MLLASDLLSNDWNVNGRHAALKQAANSKALFVLFGFAQFMDYYLFIYLFYLELEFKRQQYSCPQPYHMPCGLRASISASSKDAGWISQCCKPDIAWGATFLWYQAWPELSIHFCRSLPILDSAGPAICLMIANKMPAIQQHCNVITLLRIFKFHQSPAVDNGNGPGGFSCKSKTKSWPILTVERAAILMWRAWTAKSKPAAVWRATKMKGLCFFF